MTTRRQFLERATGAGMLATMPTVPLNAMERQLQNNGWEGVHRAYVHCIGQKYRKSSELMVGPAREPDWDFVELDAPRNAMMTHPQLVADTLLRLAWSNAATQQLRYPLPRASRSLASYHEKCKRETAAV